MMNTAKKRWTVLDQKRSGVLRRARSASAITIPSALPPEGHTEDSPLKTPFQSLGARGVNNLASKLLLALLPSTTTFFRLRISKELQAALGGDDTEVEDSLRALENDGLLRIEKSNLRTIAHAAIKHMVITGNALIHMAKGSRNSMYRLSQFCIQRDPSGRVVEILIKESVTKETLSPVIRAACQVDTTETGGADSSNTDLFTWVKLEGEKHKWHQEINDIEVPGSKGQVAEADSPFIVMRWSAVENEDYGRGMVEEYLGDLISLEGLSKSIIQYAAAAARVVILLHPNSHTDEDDLVKAESGDVVTGSLDDVDMLQLEKSADFRDAKAVFDEISLRLSHAFLLRSGTVRDAERVTAEEIRSQAQELEDVLGGVYTVQAHEFQMPLVRRLLYLMEKDGDFPKFPKVDGKDSVSPTIVTGFEALGRGHELNKLRGFFADVREIFGDAALSRFKDDKAIRKIATAHNVDVKDMLKTDDEMSAEANQGMMADAVSKAAGPVAGQLAKSATESQ